MTSLGVITIVAGLLVGYVVTWAFIGKSKEKSSFDSSDTESTDNSKHYGTHHGNERSAFDENSSSGNDKKIEKM